MSLRRRRQRGEKPKAAIDMTSLIDLTFLLLVTFIVTLPALEQGVSIKLPQAKTDELPAKNNKANVITLAYPTGLYFNDNPTTLADLREILKGMVAEDAEVPVLVRGDVRLDYGSVMEAVKVLYDTGVQRMALVTVEK
ncbi:MAG: biopolymer transporter ExbD [Kiritimatiellae bacterium]|nr:biopolymer transporter ExbD [Kiritimatiellia bacterium]MBR4603840.1 biopolymer transporter ExbD [Kiritimatiellia bacterium]